MLLAFMHALPRLQDFFKNILELKKKWVIVFYKK